jgi:hypothetical protein
MKLKLVFVTIYINLFSVVTAQENKVTYECYKTCNKFVKLILYEQQETISSTSFYKIAAFKHTAKGMGIEISSTSA